MIQNPDVRVTHHAIARYRERVAPSLGPDAVRDRIVAIVTPAAAVNAKRYALDGVTFCITYRGNEAIVTTVYVGTLPLARSRRSTQVLA